MSAYNGNGLFVIAGVGLPYVTSTTISSTVANQLNTDLATGLSNVICKDGQTTPTNNIPMGGFKLTGLGVATAPNDALSYGNPINVSSVAINGTAPGTLFTQVQNGNGGANALISNNDPGAAAYSQIQLSNGTYSVGLTQFGTGYAAPSLQNGAQLHSTGPGGMNFLNDAGPWTWQTGATLLMTMPLSGNLGLHTAPSAWGANATAIELRNPGNAFWSLGANDTRLTANIYFDGANYRYATNDFGTLYYQAGGIHHWGHFASGVAGAAAAYVNDMTLDNTGKLGIGMVPAYGLSVQAGTGIGDTAIIQHAIGHCLQMGEYNVNNFGFWENVTPNTANHLYTFRYDGTGQGWNVAAGGTFAWNLNNVEEGRFGSDGSFLVGTPANGGWNGNSKIEAKQTVTGYALSAYNNTGGGGGGGALLVRVDSTPVSFASFIFNGPLVGSISTNGTNTSYNTSSDARLKNNIVDAPDAGAIIDALRVRQWDWKSDGSHQAFGLVAQEEALVFADGVLVGDSDPATIGEQWMRDDSKLVPLLVKEIQSLRARLTAAGL